MRIILDGMGGDNAPAAVVEGAVLASEETEHEIQIIGQQELIREELSKLNYGGTQISVADAREVISNEEAPFHCPWHQYGEKRRRRYFHFCGKHRCADGRGAVYSGKNSGN